MISLGKNKNGTLHADDFFSFFNYEKNNVIFEHNKA
jgi:hypothetical protein